MTTALNILQIEIVHTDEDVIAYANINQRPLEVSIVYNNPENVSDDQVIAQMFLTATQINPAEFDVVDIKHTRDEVITDDEHDTV